MLISISTFSDQAINSNTRDVQLITEHVRFCVVWCVSVRISRDLISYELSVFGNKCLVAA